MTEAKRTFYYIDAMPGAGKTEYFVNQAAALLNNPDPKYILVYVAPTISLLKEAFARVFAHPEVARRKKALVPRVLVVADPQKVTAEFKATVYRQIKDPPSHALNYLFGLTTKEDYEARKYKQVKHRHSLDGEAPFGSVVMTTHESFVRVSKDDPTGRGSERLSHITVIFDEARKCVLSTSRLFLKNTNFTKLVPLLERDLIDSDENGAAKRGSNWNLVRIMDLKPADEFKSAFGVTSIAALPSEIKTVRAQFAKAAATEGRGAMYMLTNARAGQFLSRTEENVMIYLVLRPATLFAGYRRVILTSAFFRDSQMFHFLKEDGHTFVNLRRDPRTKDRPDIQAISLRDQRLRKAAFNRLLVAPLLKPPVKSSDEHTGHKTLTRALLDSGMVVSTDLARASKGKINPNMKLERVIESLATKSGPVTEDAELNTRLRHYAVPPLWVLLNRAAQIFRIWAKDRPYLGPHPLSLLTLNSPRAHGYTMGRSWAPNGVHYLDAVYHITGHGSMLFDRSKSKTRSEANSKEQEYDALCMGPKWMKLIRSAMYHELDEAVFTLPRSPNLHGINAFSKYHAFTHLAALNPDAGLIRVYAGLIPKYDIDMDHSIENLVQTLYRTSLRNPDATEQVLMIVPYQSAADLLATKIKSPPFKVLCVPRLTPFQHQKERDEEQESRRRAAVSKARTKYDPAFRQEIRKIQNLIVQARRRLKSDPGSKATLATLDRHEKALEKLKARAAVTKQ